MADPAQEQRPVRVAAVLRDGILAGLLGAFCVAAVHLLYDSLTAEPLRTPAALYGLTPDGEGGLYPAVLTIEAAVQYTGLHVGLWLVVGLAMSLLVSVSDAYPKLWYAAMAAIGFFVSSLLYLTFTLDAPGLSGLNLWLGTLAGGAAMACFLILRHPGVLEQTERSALTAVGARYLVTAITTEQETLARLERADASVGPRSVFEPVIAEKGSRVRLLAELMDHFDVPHPRELGATSRPAALSLESVSLESALDEAISEETRIVELYDRLLPAVDELLIRDAFLRLRAASADELLPGLEQSRKAATADTSDASERRS